MNVENSNQFGKIDKAKLKIFESNIKAILPNDYKTFLIEHNGGKPIPNYFNISSEKKDITRLHHCFGLHSGPVHKSIDHSYNIYKNRIPKYVLAIADDPFGNLICIGISADQYGKIFFWDHESEVEPVFFKSVALISESFDDFLSKLYQWKDPNESEIENAIKEDNVILFDSLLSEDFDIEKKDEYGRTMIENATINNSIKIIRYLYLKGAKLRDSLKYAEQNAEFFEDHKKSADFIKSLKRGRMGSNLE